MVLLPNKREVDRVILRGMEHPMNEHQQEILKQVADAASIATVIGTLMNALPEIAALVSLVWSIIRIWETDTVQKWRKKRNARCK